MIITSAQNPKVKYVLGLRERRKRDDTQLLLVEGFEELSLALDSGATPAELFYCPAYFHGGEMPRLVERLRAQGVLLIEVAEHIFAKIAYRDNPDGWLATLPTPVRTLDTLPLGETPCVVVSESVEKPGNLGAMLRTADAAGVDAIIACDPRTDWANPNVVRASKGAIFSVPVCEAGSAETLAWLRAHKITVLVATPDATTAYTNVDMRGPVAIVVGTEKQGVSRMWLDEADQAVQIPMFGRVNSLNVSTATALLIYEVVRQRGA